MGCCTGRCILITICIIQLVATLERQVFDFLGYMWAPIIGNFLQIIFVIVGLFGTYQYRPRFIIFYTLWSLLWLGWNIFVICFYLQVGVLSRDSSILNLGTGNKSWWLDNGIGCKVNQTTPEVHESFTSRQIPPEWAVSGCILQYYWVEIIHAGVQCLLTLIGFIVSCYVIYIFTEEDDSLQPANDELEYIKMRYKTPGAQDQYNDNMTYQTNTRTNFDTVERVLSGAPTLEIERSRGRPPQGDTTDNGTTRSSKRSRSRDRDRSRDRTRSSGRSQNRRGSRSRSRDRLEENNTQRSNRTNRKSDEAPREQLPWVQVSHNEHHYGSDSESPPAYASQTSQDDPNLSISTNPAGHGNHIPPHGRHGNTQTTAGNHSNSNPSTEVRRIGSEESNSSRESNHMQYGQYRPPKHAPMQIHHAQYPSTIEEEPPADRHPQGGGYQANPPGRPAKGVEPERPPMPLPSLGQLKADLPMAASSPKAARSSHVNNPDSRSHNAVQHNSPGASQPDYRSLPGATRPPRVDNIRPKSNIYDRQEILSRSPTTPPLPSPPPELREFPRPRNDSPPSSPPYKNVGRPQPPKVPENYNNQQNKPPPPTRSPQSSLPANAPQSSNHPSVARVLYPPESPPPPRYSANPYNANPVIKPQAEHQNQQNPPSSAYNAPPYGQKSQPHMSQAQPPQFQMSNPSRPTQSVESNPSRKQQPVYQNQAQVFGQPPFQQNSPASSDPPQVPERPPLPSTIQEPPYTELEPRGYQQPNQFSYPARPPPPTNYDPEPRYSSNPSQGYQRADRPGHYGNGPQYDEGEQGGNFGNPGYGMNPGGIRMSSSGASIV
ncbi:unnamed protein product [Owenia fusiformis]|uniref:Sodium/potassium-transporting ATPase subunit beta-1-interacting protein n=1 Tax=Owenia fusiformis TaxID=6347 RepID=A0A8J1Y1S2_OWEFU|nr:unnamed protein product [Owenia fusiformis]